MLEPAYGKGIIEAGCDEAGRGCLAGPVYAGAVILPPDFKHPLLNDSKKLNRQQREKIRPVIEECALSWAVAWCDHQEIDEINILNASILAMHRALEKLEKTPEFILVDGNRFKPYRDIPYRCFVGGDGKYQSIAAASILAKTHRDEYMESLHKNYPQYNWQSNKGYPTKAHKAAISRAGISPFHRKSFRLDEQLKMDL